MNKVTKKSSIRNRLLLFSLCISLIPSAVITSIYYFNTRYIIKKQVLDELTALADAKKQHIISCIEAKKERTRDFSSDGLITKRLEIARCEGALPGETVSALNRHLSRNKRTLDPSLLGIAITDTGGTIIASTNERFIGANIATSTATTPDSQKKPGVACVSVSPPHYSSYLNTNCLSISTPIFSGTMQGKILGIIVNSYDLDILSSITTDYTKLGETGEIYLVNKDKIMLTGSRFLEDTPLKQMVDTEPVRKIIDHGKEMTGIYPDYRNLPVVGASAYMTLLINCFFHNTLYHI